MCINAVLTNVNTQGTRLQSHASKVLIIYKFTINLCQGIINLPSGYSVENLYKILTNNILLNQASTLSIKKASN